MNNFNGYRTLSFVSRFISFLSYVYSIIEFYCLYTFSVIISDKDTKTESVDYIKLLAPTELSERYWFLENVLKLEDEINRNVELIGRIFSSSGENDDIRVITGIELGKIKMLKKGKLKMFRDLCLVALNEIPPIEGDKEVTLDDLEGFWCLLGIEAEKHRQSVDDILKPKSPNKRDLSCDVTDSAVSVKKIKPSSMSEVYKKPILNSSETKATIKANKSNIDERNRKYMERMKKLRERKAKPTVKVQDKENQNPNPITIVTSKEEIKVKPSGKALTLSPRIQWQF